MDKQALTKRIQELTWTHIIDFGDGIESPGLWRPASLDEIGCPKSLQGKSVLDICAADGAYSFAVEQRGASYVLATDSCLWGDWAGTGKAAFDFTREFLQSGVDSKHLDVLDHLPERVGSFDLVLFLGVLYHMQHPLLALQRVYSVTRDQLILETHLDLLDCEKPAMAFYPGDELNGDATSWWGPNVAAVKGMLKTAGFSRVEVFSTKPYDIEVVKKLPVFRNAKFDTSGTKQGRGVFHAWR